VSPAHQSHPELEYFRPLWNFLRKAGIAFALISVAVIGGALVLRAGHGSMADMTSMTARLNETPSSAATTSGADRATATTAAERAPPEAGRAACAKDTWAYLDGKCFAGRARKVRSPRAATDGPLVRSALPVPEASQPPAKLATGADAAASAPAAVKQTGQPNPGLKKARKTAISQTSGRDVGESNSSSPKNPGLKKARKTAISQTSGRDVGESNSSSRKERGRDERWSARAYAFPDSRNPAGPYERSWGWSR
jgi:hypothetical protein